ncbi:MAG: hypothetical protein ACYC35_12055 [Pirellulales bacterium]
MKRFGLIVLILTVTISMGCRRSTTVTTPEGKQVTVKQSGDRVDVTVAGKDGEKIQVSGGGAGVPLPESFPKDVPVYPGSTVATSATMKEATQVSLQTGDSTQKAVTFYQSKLKENGWDIENTMNMQQGNMLAAKKADSRLTVMIMAQDDKTMISLTLTKEKN